MDGPDATAGKRWDREALEHLGADEFDFREYKASEFLWSAGAISADLQHDLSRQISAFANGGGGQLFLGVDDLGQPDNGIPVDLKSGGTRSWLEDLIPGLVDPPLRRFNVFEVGHRGGFARPLPGRAVYVVDLPTSDDAPHMSRDHRYYLRIAGKSRPMSHVHVQDIALRVRRPRVVVSRIAPYGAPEIVDDPRGPLALCALRVLLSNHGKRLARHVGLELVVPRAFAPQQARARMLAAPNTQVTHRPADYRYFRHHGLPVFPEQEVFAWELWLGVHRGNAAQAPALRLQWRVWADDAVQDGEVAVGHLALVRRAVAAVDGDGW